jgi:hypothetical protein
MRQPRALLWGVYARAEGLLRASTRGWAFSFALLLLTVGSFSCASKSQQIPQGSNTTANANAGAALGNAVAAGVIWATGGGCRLQGCPYGSYCSGDSGFCQVRKCSEGCPPSTVCNEGLDRCQAAAPAKVPNDFLPVDNKIATPPTVH